jgi:RNA polymerase sigma-70 factor (ECF subfamily)
MERMGGDDGAEVERARGGDQEAFRLLVERHSRAVFRLAFRMTGNEHDAEDVVQETFVKAFRRLHQFESRANFGTWLHRIAANCAYDVLRSRSRRSEETLETETEANPARALPAQDPSPDRLMLSAEVRSRVSLALSRLSPVERTAFVLRHHQGMSIQEIGAALGLEPSATKHSIFRAVRKMRAALSPLAGATS